MQDLVALLLAGAAAPEQLRTLVLRILAVQLIDRQRSSSVISAISSGGQSGLLSMLLHRAIASVADSSSKVARRLHLLTPPKNNLCLTEVYLLQAQLLTCLSLRSEGLHTSAEGPPFHCIQSTASGL